jgi:hypothetical protein
MVYHLPLPQHLNSTEAKRDHLTRFSVQPHYGKHLPTFPLSGDLVVALHALHVSQAVHGRAVRLYAQHHGDSVQTAILHNANGLATALTNAHVLVFHLPTPQVKIRKGTDRNTVGLR